MRTAGSNRLPGRAAGNELRTRKKYVSDRDARFKQPSERCKLLTRWAFEYFDQTGIPLFTLQGLDQKKSRRATLPVAKTKALVKLPCQSVIFAHLQSHFSAVQFAGFGFDRFEQQTPDAPSAAAGGNGQIVNVDQRFGGERGETSHANRDPHRAAVQPSEKNQRPRVSL